MKRKIRYNYISLTKEIIEDGKPIPFDEIIDRLNELENIKEKNKLHPISISKDLCVRCKKMEREYGVLCWNCETSRALN